MVFDKDDLDILKGVGWTILISVVLWFLWGNYVMEMHKYEPNNYNWPDEIFGIRPK